MGGETVGLHKYVGYTVYRWVAHPDNGLLTLELFSPEAVAAAFDELAAEELAEQEKAEAARQELLAQERALPPGVWMHHQYTVSARSYIVPVLVTWRVHSHRLKHIMCPLRC